MPIVLVRIDDRLVHGQVVEGWLRSINANYIVVASDEVAADKMQQTLLSIAVPHHIKVNSFSIQDVIEKIKADYFAKDTVMLLFSNPQDVLRVLQQQKAFLSVNVGGMHFVTGKKQILRALSVDERDIATFREIRSLGVELEGRVLPNDELIDVIKIIDENLASQNTKTHE